ncbi:uncharacterized protein LOC114299965 [Camellia sinensis]|uniref:uncharacterized protein LOC114299965 n=1 Tax=Camellia sinensis TaxID=4442 RepID=UPI001036E49C|nr:uncharacterized protein LOC114299965 [Camellia sinensis]
MASIRTSPRTQSKSKGVVIDKSSSLEDTHNHLSHKATWDSALIRVFLQLIANEITKGNRLFLVLSQAGYKSLARKFERKTGRKHGLKQLKNKYMCLKKEWQAWTKLMDSSKGVSGIGINCDTGMFQAPEEWWDKMESKKKTLEHRELMKTVFMGASATGKHHWTPGEELPEATDDSSDSVHSLGAQLFADPIPARVQDVDSDSSREHVLIEKGKKRKTPSSSVLKSKKATSGASVIAESMNTLTDVVRTKNQQVTVRHLTSNESLFTISECMHCLTGITSLVGTPLFHFATSLIDNADLREVMICQPDDDSIIGWLTQK